MIPIISLKIYCERHSIKWAFTAQFTFLYVLMTVLNIPLTRILVNVVEAILSTTIYVETTKYTVIAIISCILLPYIMECVEKFIQVNVEISIRKIKRKNTKQKTDTLTPEETDEN